MPGSVANAAPSVTMPISLCSAFKRERHFAALVDVYPDGSDQRALLVSTSRNRWSLTKRLTPLLMTELRTFWLARGGPLEPFYFYDPYETSPRFTSTPSGTTGRYTVRFEGTWNQQMGAGLGEVSISLVELA